METRESLIEDLRNLGVRLNEILACRPTDRELKEIRDGLLRLGGERLPHAQPRPRFLY